MRPGIRRRLAESACGILQNTLPSRLRSWGWAIRSEIADIPDDTEALLFALDSFFGLLPRAILYRLLCPFAALASSDPLLSGGMMDMRFYDDVVRRPQAIGIACALGAVVSGLAYMAVAHAPMHYLGANAGALVLGVMMLALAGRVMSESRHWPGVATIAFAGVLLATAMLGERADGAARWVKLGPLFIQPSLILLPVMIVGFTRSRNALSAAGIIGAAVALAIQPDRAMAGMLAGSLAVLAIIRADRFVLATLAASAIGFVVTLVRADTLPATPYVDQILYSAFEVHALAGVAVVGGSILLIVPAIVGWLYDAANREAYSVFAAVWLAAILAAALGNYPTPIVGYGGSAIIGYVLSLVMLPKVAGARLGVEVAARAKAVATPSGRHPRIRIAHPA